MNGWKKYGLAAASMVVLVIAILLVSGAGSAVASQISSVFVTNTADHPVPVSGTVTVDTPAASPLRVQETNTDSSGAVKVHEQGTAHVDGSVSVSNLPATQPVSGTVDVGNFPSNFPAAPTTKIIAHGVTTVAAGNVATLVVPLTDVSDYREVTVYLEPSTTGGSGQVCIPDINGPDNSNIALDKFQFGDTFSSVATIKTYNPAPPNFEMECFNFLGQDVQDTWMLVGRTD